MRVEVKPLYLHGRMLKKAQVEQQAAVVGNLSIFENRLHNLGRAVPCAKLTSFINENVALIPELREIHVIWLVGQKMRVCGIEEIASVHHAQTWDIRVL